jgi:hypothetical protein
MTTTESFRIECRGCGDGKVRTIEVRDVRDCPTEEPDVLVIAIALVGRRGEHGADSSVFLTPDAAKRLAIALNHIAFQIDPTPGALGVG